MQTKIILISDNSDFFEYIAPKLKLRNSDEVFRFKFSDLPEKIHLLSSSLLIINSVNNNEQTLQLLDIINDVPCIIFGYNNDEDFVLETYKKGACAFITLAASEEEIDAKLIPALKLISSFEKTNLYREMLVNNKLITKNNEVFLDFTNLLDAAVKNINKSAATSTLVAISPDDKSKNIIQPNQLETVILNNIRKNDILMNYAYNKYFLLLNNTTKEKAISVWHDIKSKLPDGIFAGFTLIGNKSRQQVVNEVLNNLHKNISANKSVVNAVNPGNINNFKSFRKDFNKKIMHIVSPVFYQIQQSYCNKYPEIKIEQGIGEGYGILNLKTECLTACFRITSPGFSTVNIDISYENSDNNDIKPFKPEQKHISLEPEELEAGLLTDLLEEFIKEFIQVFDKEKR